MDTKMNEILNYLNKYGLSIALASSKNDKEKYSKIEAINECDCGVSIKKKPTKLFNLKLHECDTRRALSNHLTFPYQAILTSESYNIYYDKNTGKPKIHWALLLQINQVLNANKVVTGENQFGEKVKVCFSDKISVMPTTFQMESLKPHNTLVILYAQNLKSDYIVNESDLDSCYIFETPLNLLKEEAQKLVDDAVLRAKEPDSKKGECYCCGVLHDKVSRCNDCKLARYCSKTCQAKSWRDSHKKLCKKSELLLRLCGLTNLSFEGKKFTFSNENENCLPPYKPIIISLGETKLNRTKKSKKRLACGLCGQNSQQITMTECCNNPICDNEDVRHSCFFNHFRYTLCAYHMKESHTGRYKDCERCIADFSQPYDDDYKMYYFKTEPEKKGIKLTCSNCGFKSENSLLFSDKKSIRSTKRYCVKEPCQELDND